MKTTIRQLIKQHLIKVCKERTAIMRDRLETKPKKQFAKKKIQEAWDAMRKAWTIEACDALMNSWSILLDAPELSRQVFQLELFGVVVLEKANSGQPYGVNIPHIVTGATGGTANRLFYTDGRVDCGCTFLSSDDPRPATDSEIETCINNLNDKQWVTINSTTGLFAPIITEAMTTEIELLEISDGTEKEAGDEIETNGRRITIGTTKE